MNMKHLPITLAALLALLTGCQSKSSPAPADTEGLRRVKLQLNWFPEVEHGGFYAAQIHGYFREEGLDVEIVPGGTNVPVIQQLATGRVDFAIANAQQVLVGRAQDADVVALLAPMQNSPRCIMVHSESGITRLDELQNVTLAVGESDTYVDFLKQALPLQGVTIVPYSGNVSRFVKDKNFAQQAYTTSEPFIAEEQGAQPRCLLVADLGFNPYAGMLVTRGAALREDEQLVSKMRRACLRGWQHYLESPDATHEVLLKLNDEMTPEALAYGVEQLRELCLPDEMPAEQLGTMNAERWNQLAEQLLQVGAIDSQPAPIEAAFWQP